MNETLHGKNKSEVICGINLQSVIPMRREPHEQSEMISQLLFGEYYQADEFHERWLKITTRFDHYTGWIDRKLFTEISNQDYTGFDLETVPVLAARLAEISLPDSTTLIIPSGSSLPGYDGTRQTVFVTGKVLPIRALSGQITCPPGYPVIQTARQFLNDPYLWGGRSSFGLDCSGFVQTVFKIHGINLPRDTSQQAKSGTALGKEEKIKPGDLAFFASDGANINHVGLVTMPGEIIHCSGWVRIDRLDETGIFNESTRTHTHRLKVLVRISR